MVIGCEGNAEVGGVIVADSAGTRIVSYPRAEVDTPGWELDSVPMLSIGTRAGEPHQLFRVRGAFVHRGALVVADGGSGELRLFDMDGDHLKTVGGSGSGPGEFQNLQWLGRTDDDGVLTWDLALQRVTLFDPELELAGTLPLRLPVLAHLVVGAFGDGDLLVWPFGVRTEPVASPTVVVDTSYFAVTRPRDEPTVDTIARVPARPTHLEPDGSAVRVPFTGEPVHAVGGAAAWIGSGHAGEIRRYSKDGGVEVVIRMPSAGEVPASAVAEFRADFLEGHEGPERLDRSQRLDRIPFPRELPAFDMLMVDPDGRLWIRRYSLPGADEQEWTVASEEGEALASLTMPTGLRVTSITSDMVVGVWRDEVGVESVRVYGYGPR